MKYSTLGSLIIDLTGPVLLPEEKELLAHPLVGGVILFSRNYEDRQQLTSLCQSIRRSRKSPLLIMVDQEGGKVQRFRKDFTPLPPLSIFGKSYNINPQNACNVAKTTGWLMAIELLTVGVDLSLAPVLDLNTDRDHVIGERAFHDDPDVVLTLAESFIGGMQLAGMRAVGKHYPGHGFVMADSHVTLPHDPRTLPEIKQKDLKPFIQLIKKGLPAIMVGHILFPHIDTQIVSFSRLWLHKILREDLNFKGVIFSDDLNMEGANISPNPADKVALAHEAGCDFLLFCNNRNAVIYVLDQLSYHDFQVSKEKWSLLQPTLKSTSVIQQEPWRLARQQLNLLVNL